MFYGQWFLFVHVCVALKNVWGGSVFGNCIALVRDDGVHE